MRIDPYGLDWKNTLCKAVVKSACATGGTVGGALAGCAVDGAVGAGAGSLVAPGAGTVAGGVGGCGTGAVAGGVTGALAGLKYGDELANDWCGDDEDDKCEKAKKDAESAYHKLTTKRIPQYLYGSRHGSADEGHYQAILEMQTRLRDAIRRVHLYCVLPPPEMEKWERLANQVFPRRH